MEYHYEDIKDLVLAGCEYTADGKIKSIYGEDPDGKIVEITAEELDQLSEEYAFVRALTGKYPGAYEYKDEDES